jgi:DNA-3-methyladenine glycosylase II
MAFDFREPTRRIRHDPWADAVAHLRAADARWIQLVERIGPCRLRPRRDRFGTLVRAIIGQQISSKAAASIEARLCAVAGRPHDPDRLLKLGLAALRQAGLSSQKSGYILNLAEALASERLPLARIGRWQDDQIIDRLTSVKGIGRWTAEMFLIFALNRPDVLPVSDLGIRGGLRRHYGLAEIPGPAECEALAAPWRPFRSVAMWYIWKGIDTPLPEIESHTCSTA